MPLRQRHNSLFFCTIRFSYAGTLQFQFQFPIFFLVVVVVVVYIFFLLFIFSNCTRYEYEETKTKTTKPIESRSTFCYVYDSVRVVILLVNKWLLFFFFLSLKTGAIRHLCCI